MGHLFNDLGSWIIRFIDSVSEPVQKFLSAFNVLNKLWNVLFLTDLLKHSQNCFVGASVSWTVKGTWSTSDASVDVNTWRWQVSDCCSGAVKFVFGMQNEQNLKGTHKFGMWLELLFVQLIEHVQKVLNVTQLLRWKVKVSADSVSIRVGGNGRYVS